MKILLTDSLISKTTCPVGKEKTTLTDKAITGFCVEVRKSGVKTFIFRYQDSEGVQQQYKIGDAKVIKTVDARKIATKLTTRVASGENPQAERMKVKECPTFAEFVAERYIPFIKTDKRSFDTDISLLKNHLLPEFGSFRLNAITRNQLETYKLEKAEFYAPGTVNRHLVLIRYILNLAIEWETTGIEKNPAEKMKMLPTNNEKNCILSDEDMRKIIALSKDSQNKSLFAIIVMLGYTGGRKREVLDARWEHIDLENNTLLVPKAKSGKPRQIPLNDVTKKLLVSLPTFGTGEEFVFPNPKTGKPFTSVYYGWDAIRTKAGLGHVRMHDLRHNFASWLVMSGETLYTVQHILGHADPKTTQRYAHLSNGHLVSASNKLQQSLAGSAADILGSLRQVA